LPRKSTSSGSSVTVADGSSADLHRAVDPNRHPGLSISQIYLDHAHFEHTSNPFALLPHEDRPEAKLTVTTTTFELTSQTGTKAAGIMVQVSSVEGSDHPYRLDVAVTGLVEAIEGEENFPPSQYVSVAGATLLFPFLREVVANITGRGRIGALWLRPFNVQLAVQGARESPRDPTVVRG
jgi:preprotein translocase subunit SecB